MKQNRMIAVVAMILLVGAVGVAVAQSTNQSATNDPSISKQEAKAIAEEEAGGIAQSATLEQEGGPVYEVPVEGEDGAIIEVEVDGETGEVLETENANYEY